MTKHIKAWNREYERSTWKGHYSLDLLPADLEQGRVLDAGCGSGKYSIPFKMRGFDVVGIDVSPKALKMAHESSKNRDLDIDFLAADICRIPFLDSSFDIVWCFGVLQHLLLMERTAAIHEFHRVLRNGGYLFIEVFGNEDMRYGGTEVEEDTFSRENGIIYHYFNKKELEELLHGFSSVIMESRNEKRFRGTDYMRHMISAVAKKSDP